MSLVEYKERLSGPLKQATLCLLMREGEILLAKKIKKGGLGEGKWNGVGGKPEKGETIEQAFLRETEEEIKVTPVSWEQVATLNFYCPCHPDWNQQVVVFLVDQWDGEPSETAEMSPRWFKREDIPYSKMWPDDRHWLPKVLEGKRLEAEFLLDGDDAIVEFEIQEIQEKEAA